MPYLLHRKSRDDMKEEMMEGNSTISGRKAKNRRVIPRHWRYTAVRTAAAVSINPNVFIDTILKKSESK